MTTISIDEEKVESPPIGHNTVISQQNRGLMSPSSINNMVLHSKQAEYFAKNDTQTDF